jgi:DNA-binding MarR family transcriptional regulator
MNIPSTGYLLGRLVFALERTSEHLLQTQIGLSYKRFLFLTVLVHTGTVTQHELATALGYSDPAVSTMLVELTKEGFLEVSQNPEHRRKHLVTITEYGREIVARGRQILDIHFDKLTMIAGVDSQQLRDSAEQLYRALQQKIQEEESI